MSHSLLSPSSSKQWTNCPPSARLTEYMEDRPSAYAAEGTLAHSFAEDKLKHYLGIGPAPDRCEDPVMDEATDDYVAFVAEQMASLTDPFVYVEQRVDCTEFIPECYGTADALIISEGILHLCDLKYGAGIRVEAQGNCQLSIYALGALSMLDYLFDIQTVRMSIFQPRLSHADTWEVPVEELRQWAEDVLIPAAKLAWEGKGEYKAGDHCQFCKAKAECRTRAEMNMALAAYDFTGPALLTTDEIADILGKADALTAWASDVKDFALNQALAGTHFDGWKVVEGRSVRKYTNEDDVAAAVKALGLDPYEHKVLGITAMTSLLGKKKFEETLAGFIHKPAGKPVLVPSTDKRKEINTAADDFADPIM